MERPSRYAVRTAAAFLAGTAGRRAPLMLLASAARSPFAPEVAPEFTGGGENLHHELTVDSSSPVHGGRR
ncbi:MULTISPECIES: hypothetical protein [unclassified Streptomyces]|uniref:hypothetical protein n=1 Tax=unclassified Streptomyces TaxID=2593676 RepID=UPI00344F393E